LRATRDENQQPTSAMPHSILCQRRPRNIRRDCIRIQQAVGLKRWACAAARRIAPDNDARPELSACSRLNHRLVAKRRRQPDRHDETQTSGKRHA
jgi:hypothetical protein